MKKLWIVCVLALSLSMSNAQDKLITVEGDTLNGKIEILYPDKYYEEIIFEKDDDKQRMKAYEFTGFVQNGDIYKTIKHNDVYRIMMLEKPGYLSLYKFRVDQSYTFGGQFAYRQDGRGIEIPNMLFKKTMSNFLDDCSSVKTAIEDGKLRRRDMVVLVDKYNACLETKTEMQMSERADESTTPAVEPATAVNAASLAQKATRAGDAELSTMLSDVASKLRSGQTVPSYLKSAIKEHVKNDHELYEEVTLLLADI